MDDQWFYRMFDEEFGPVPRATLEELLSAGTLSDSDQVRSAAADRWVTLGSVLQSSSSSQTGTAIAEPVAESSDDVQEWYCKVIGQELGPLSFNELLRFAEGGELSATDEVKLGAAGKWRRVGSIGRIAAVLPYQTVQKNTIAKPLVQASAARQQPTAAAPAPAAEAAPSAPAVAYQPAAHEPAWFAWIQGVEYGPFSLLQLGQMCTTGQIGPADVVKYGPLGAWTPSGVVPQQLAQLVIAVPAAAAAPTAAAAVAAPAQPAPAKTTPATEATAAAKPTAAASAPAKSTPVPSTSASAAAAATSAKAASPPPAPVAKEPAAAAPVVEKPAPPPAPKAEPRPTPVAAAASPPSSFTSAAAASRPAPPRPAPRPSRPPTDWGALLAPILNPKLLGTLGGIALGGALVYWLLFAGPGTAGDKDKLEKLVAILKQIQQLREKNAGGGEWDSLQKTATADTKPMVAELEKTASRDYPAKQLLLWSAKYRLPEIFAKDKTKVSQAEYEMHKNLVDAAEKLGVPNTLGPPPEVTEGAAKSGAPGAKGGAAPRGERATD